MPPIKRKRGPPPSVHLNEIQIPAKRSAIRQRTQHWTEAEKERVFEKLQTGRVSITSIAEHVGPTKSLGQVAEFLEYMQLWSRLLPASEEPLPPPPEAECAPVDPLVSIKEEAKIIMSAHREDKETIEGFATNEIEILRYMHRLSDTAIRFKMFDTKFGLLLAQMLAGKDETAVAIEAYAELGKALEFFVRKVYKEAISICAFYRPFKFFDTRKIFSMNKDHINEAVVACGFEVGKPFPVLMNELLEKYVDDDVLAELAAQNTSEPIETNGKPSEAIESEDESETSEDSDSGDSDSGDIEDGGDSEDGEDSEDSEDNENKETTEQSPELSDDKPTTAHNVSSGVPSPPLCGKTDSVAFSNSDSDSAVSDIGSDAFVIHDDPSYYSSAKDVVSDSDYGGDSDGSETQRSDEVSDSY
ncbi:hypothetical protein LPJ66_006195 [Kickxella alabastrina]|uniref:Uncharacterized protein n=1 Tax=Kickxella alabastrina TaxID=61397 RepID=A0ACC1IG49_9FUNG|nr:hypothetical protein LPJ66_006195 [Kickxella alabastrina]